MFCFKKAQVYSEHIYYTDSTCRTLYYFKLVYIFLKQVLYNFIFYIYYHAKVLKELL